MALFTASWRAIRLVGLIAECYFLVYRFGALDKPNQPEHTRLVRFFSRKLNDIMGIKVQAHGPIPEGGFLYVANHVSWLDVGVLGSHARVFFLGKKEISEIPIFGKLAKAGGTLFVKRGSGDSKNIAGQIAQFLSQNIPVLFFPEATTTEGKFVKKIHANLLASALEANKPIQPIVMAYVTPKGELDMVVPFIGDDSLMDHLIRMLKYRQPIVAHIMALPLVSPEGKDLETVRLEVEQSLSKGLANLHQQLQIRIN